MEIADSAGALPRLNHVRELRAKAVVLCLGRRTRHSADLQHVSMT